MPELTDGIVSKNFGTKAQQWIRLHCTNSRYALCTAQVQTLPVAQLQMQIHSCVWKNVEATREHGTTFDIVPVVNSADCNVCVLCASSVARGCRALCVECVKEECIGPALARTSSSGERQSQIPTPNQATEKIGAKLQ